ncbi:MAG: XisH family protein [Caldilineaceae bacterium]
MPNKDRFHDAVRKALEKERWKITHDPLFLNFAQVEMYVDLGAEPLLAAEKDDAQIAIEIKTFLGSSAINEFHTALGQYLNYQVALEDQHPGRVLYLAVPLEIYESFFRLEFGQIAIRRYRLKLIVYDPDQEVIVQWLP